jgi:hypothetical protein
MHQFSHQAGREAVAQASASPQQVVVQRVFRGTGAHLDGLGRSYHGRCLSWFGRSGHRVWPVQGHKPEDEQLPMLREQGEVAC